jgi:glutamate dehydrogenase (NAD(P)+)
VITGKSPECGGIVGRAGATGRGLGYAIEFAANELGIDLPRSTAVIQGYGKVGKSTVEALSHMQVVILGVSDVNGGVHNLKGIDVDELSKWFSKHGTVAGFPGGRRISNEKLLELECTILAPCAIEQQITRANAHNVKCKIEAEGANGPTTLEARRILVKKGVHILPDIFANSYGVRYSQREDVQERTRQKHPFAVVEAELKAGMLETFKEMVAAAKEWGVDWATAADMLAIKRQASFHMHGGFRP